MMKTNKLNKNYFGNKYIRKNSCKNKNLVKSKMKLIC